MLMDCSHRFVFILRIHQLTRESVRDGYVHDNVPHVEESLRSQRFGEEVGHIVGRRNERNTNATLFHTLAYVVMLAVNVLRTRVVFRIVRQVNRGAVIVPYSSNGTSGSSGGGSGSSISIGCA